MLDSGSARVNMARKVLALEKNIQISTRKCLSSHVYMHVLRVFTSK